MITKVLFIILSLFGDFAVPWSPAHPVCALSSGTDYLPADGPPATCRTFDGSWCCTWLYVVDRYCCPERDYNNTCIDDCTEEERSKDRQNALWAYDEYCIELGKPCDWNYNGGGFTHLPGNELSGCGEGEEPYGEDPYDDELEWIKACMSDGHSRGHCMAILSKLKDE
tara:strand:+ start:326 stop:829 length:504 start_codon:yes stop_codon:yes gene_type:complete